MPHIDHLIDITIDHEMMSFMDAFAGYHQIAMHKDDQQYLFPNREKRLLFEEDAFWAKKCRGNLPMFDE